MAGNPPTFDDLKMRYGTGHSYLISGSGRDKKFGYRLGVQCKLGDIELPQWIKMMRDLIERSGEEKLHQQLLCWHKEHSYRKESSEEIAYSTLVKHSMRLFDNEEWVDFLKFNRRYRPHVLDGVSVAKVRSVCCNKPFLTTQAILDKSTGGTTCCQICGRWSEFELLSVGRYEDLNDDALF